MKRLFKKQAKYKIGQRFKFLVVCLVIFALSLSNLPFYIISSLIDSHRLDLAKGLKISEALAATTGEVYPTLGESISESPWLDNAWTTPTNIYADDAATANVTASSYDSPDQTYVLKATGFDFSAIPDGSTIDGVIVRANSWYRSGQGSGSMDLCQLLNTSKAKVGTNNCSTAVPLTTNSATIITKGSSLDTWGNSLTAAWVKSANFGVAIGILATAANADVDVDYVTIEIYYTPPADTSPPTPNPMTFATAPTNDSPTQISATSTAGTDSTTPINYLFTLDNTNCGANAGTGGNSSSWQSGVAYSDSGLQPNKCYGYTITARDSVSPTPNTGTASGISSTYTSANTPGTPTLSGATATTLNLTNAENSNPASSPTTYFAVQVVTTSDAAWLSKWVDASGNPSATAVWLTDAQLDALVLQGLQSSTLYGVKVKARNQDTDETPLSAEGQGTTLAPPGPDATGYTNTETALNYANCATTGCGGRIAQTITISGTSLGSAVTNKDTCTAGASNGCVRIGNYTVPAASISTWNATQIIFSVPSGITVFGGSGTTCAAAGAGICVTQNGNNDAGGALEFWVFPDITAVSPSGTGEGKEGDSVTLSGTRFDTTQGTVVFQNCGPGDISATVGSWNDTSVSVTVPTGIVDDDDACDIKLTRAAGTGSKTDSSTNFVVLPQIDSVAAIGSNAGRTYAAGDTDGLIMLIGTHFGAAGSVTVLGSAATQHATAEGQCSFGGWRATTTCREVPNPAGYTGNIILTRTADSKSHTYAGTFRVLPRITGITPGSGTFGDSFTLSGNHFCQNGGTCPSAFDASNKITFNGGATTTDFFAWTGTSASSSAPSAASTGNVTLTSNTYVSNGINFTVLSPTPSNPTNLNQYKDAGLTQAIAVGAVASSTPIYLTMTMQVGLSGGTLYPQVEYKDTLVSFVCGAGACGSAVEGTGQAGPGPVTGTVAVSPSDNTYHWQARVRHNKGGTDYYSSWVSFPLPPSDNSESATDFQIDATAPTISFSGDNTCASATSSLSSNGVTINWTLNENADGQLEYSKNSNLSSSTLYPVPPRSAAASHSVALSNLDSNTTYYFKVKSTDSAGNTANRPSVAPFCSFTTVNVTQPAKTVKFYINGLTGAVSGGGSTSTSFSVYIPEATISIKSAFVELTAISNTSGTNNFQVAVNAQATSTYAIASGESFFKLIYPVDSGNLNIDPTGNILNLAPSLSANIVSAKIYVTYGFTP